MSALQTMAIKDPPILAKHDFMDPETIQRPFECYAAARSNRFDQLMGGRSRQDREIAAILAEGYRPRKRG